MLVDTENSPNAKLVPLKWNEVKWTGGIWQDVDTMLRDVTVPHLQSMFEDKDISHVLENFRICVGLTDGEHDGTVFGDGDFYKWMESAMYIAGKTNNTNLLDKLDEYIDLIEKTQLEDGYISTKQILAERQGKGSRLGDINEFEVYNMGHLFTSATLHYRITGKTNFLNVAKKAGLYLKTMYEDAEKTGEVQTAVCPSHYMGLIELYRATNDKTFLDLALLSIQLRDKVKNGLDDNQDRIPLKEHRQIVGHGVRANYLYSGVADLLLEIDDKDYEKVLDSVYEDLIRSKIYVNGGCGAVYNGTSPYGNFFVDEKVHQAYGYHYQLPNVTAYNETCANIGLVMWCYRMFLKNPKAEYMDLIERIMLNINLAAVSISGNKYFYQNSLRRTKDLPYELIWPLTRSEYILSYCCPPNLARNLAQSSEYIYLKSRATLYTGLYGENKANINLDTATFDIEQKTLYPYDGKILFKVTNIQYKDSDKFNIKFRIPSWVTRGNLHYNNNSINLENNTGYINVEITEKTKTEILLNFDMTPNIVITHPYVEETTFQGAIERGPLVYCVEGMDVDADTIDNLLITPKIKFSPVQDKIENRSFVSLECEMLYFERDKNQELYTILKTPKFTKKKVKLIPYFAWDNRGFEEMKVWLPINFNI